MVRVCLDSLYDMTGRRLQSNLTLRGSSPAVGAKLARLLLAARSRSVNSRTRSRQALIRAEQHCAQRAQPS
jgi:hypothetical protein